MHILHLIPNFLSSLKLKNPTNIYFNIKYTVKLDVIDSREAFIWLGKHLFDLFIWLVQAVLYERILNNSEDDIFRNNIFYIFTKYVKSTYKSQKIIKINTNHLQLLYILSFYVLCLTTVDIYYKLKIQFILNRCVKIKWL